MPDPTATCARCGGRFGPAELWPHLRDEHGIEVTDDDFETWPDGELVIHDRTLEPADFDEGRS
jgi:hypothetical protein